MNPETMMAGRAIADNDREMRRRRLRFRAQHRGIREMDLLVGRFAEEVLPQLSDQELMDFELLMEMPDSEVLNWLLGRQSVPTEFDTSLFAKLRAFHTHPHPLYR